MYVSESPSASVAVSIIDNAVSSSVDTDWMSATGASLLETVMITLSAGDESVPSLTISEKVRTVSVVTDGVVKVGDSAVVDDSEIPAGAVQRKVSVSPFGSDEPEPSSITGDDSLTVASGPALAVGELSGGGSSIKAITDVAVTRPYQQNSSLPGAPKSSALS